MRTLGSRQAVPADVKLSRCGVCNVIFKSREDKKDKRKFSIQNTWIGCEFDECEHWVHVRCSGLKITKKFDIENLEFFCPEHVET